MSLTEKEARKKFCPFRNPNNCAATSCMAWEFIYETGYWPGPSKNKDGELRGRCLLINNEKT